MKYGKLLRPQATLTALALTAITSLSPLARADFQYQETTQITGGSVVGLMKMAGTFSKAARQAGEPIVSEVLVKGNRMARVTNDRTEITDLDRETITTIDNTRHEYSVVTFEQLREQMQKAMRDAQERQQHAKKETAPAPSDANLTFDVHVRRTGVVKQVAGVMAEEAIMTMTVQSTQPNGSGGGNAGGGVGTPGAPQTGGLAITNDMWLAEEIPGYDEVRDFERRYALKIGMIFSGAVNPAMLASQPGAGQGMATMAKEMSKLKGIPVQQITRTGATADGAPLPAASEAPLPADTSPQMPSTGDVAQQTATSALASRFGLGGFGHKKKNDPPPAADAQPTAAQTAAASVLIESTTQYTTLSSARVDAARFEVPAGYKQVNR